jgi:hypothetical protein
MDEIKFNKVAGARVKMAPMNTNIYPTDKMLNREMPEHKECRICVYRIVVKPSSPPFLEYLLYNEQRTNTLRFPMVGNPHEFYEKYIGPNAAKHYRGNCEHDGVLHVFYHYQTPPAIIENPYKQKADEWWWCLMDEICNWRKVVTIDVDQSVVGLFYAKPELIYLYDTKFNRIEVPVVGFHGSYYKLLEFIYTFGVKESDIVSMYGPSYYFTMFSRAVKYAGWYFEGNKDLIRGQIVTDGENKYDKGGVVRVALFMKNTRVLLNHPMDPIDDSEYTRQMLSNIDTRERMEQKLRLVDYDARWTNDYDSVYAGRVLMDNGNVLFDYPEIVAKTNSQQIPRSIHIIDKRTLGEKWSADEKRYDIV